ncbi:SMI1/KNR4 family protein [Streptomyces sp. NPDC090445]|uniref:SMI1/KNR4 family protein n=1 Tax=Streptomyces sp. NPDC090445 TaxID=3365963 RepID=UPI0037F339BE
MIREQWQPFLKRWSEERVDAHDPEQDLPLEAEVARGRWLGFAPARAEELAAAEARLGRTLPPSLREFLLTTDGWRDAGVFIYRLAGASGLAWMADTDEGSRWIKAYRSTEFHESDEEPEGRIIARSLCLSLDGDAAVMFLDPEDVDEHGEWAAYWLASWSGRGPTRFRSFHDLMYDQYVSFHALCRPPGATRDHWDAEVERARLAALDGAVEEPLTVLEEASRFGNGRARLLRFQMLTILGDTHTVPLERVAVVKEERERAVFLRTPLFTRELLPLVYAEEQRAPMWGSTPLRLLGSCGSEEARAMAVGFDRDEFDPNGLTYGNPEFDRAVHDILDRLNTDPAFLRPEPGPEPGAAANKPGEDPTHTVRRLPDSLWPELRAAMALWRPVDEDHIAPVVLLAHPVLAEVITEERGREILSMRRGS